MCTVSWMHLEAGYALAFNRDEQRTRIRAIPPALKQDDHGNRYLAPIDVDAGGSWLMVNEFGITACLLNFYDAEQATPHSPRTRGEIVLMFGGCRSLSEAQEIAKQMNPRSYRSFDLVLFQEFVAPVQFRWNGQALEQLTPEKILTSSSFQTEEVCAYRTQLFETTQPKTVDQLVNFQKSHDGPSPAHPPCMHRSDAETVSHCLVEVSSSSVSLRYSDGSPCRSTLSPPIKLIRHSGSASIQS